MNRREFLTADSLAAHHPVGQASDAGYRHRGYLGWITDLASKPDPEAEWPSMRLDETLLADYRETFDLMKQLGFNEISVWGFYVSKAWPTDNASDVDQKRGAAVARLIEDAHRRGIRVYSGLGVYSWGFDEIIRANPHLARGNKQAMCASEPESWKWMQRVVDFVFTRFEIDGVSMQSADLGRCPCERCRRYSDAEYHALLNVRVSQYIRSKWPNKTIGVNSWGIRFEDPATLASLKEIGRHVDYIIDAHDTARRRDPSYRKTVIDSAGCDFGTIGGPQVEPPQHWARDRWFLPTVKRVATHIRELRKDGGRACEFFFHILENPGDEISMWLAGKVLSDPDTGWEKHLAQSVEQLYGAKAGVRDELGALLVRAEDAYFKDRPPATCGTISMEPLVSSTAGPPVYLTKGLTAAQRKGYAAELKAVSSGLAKLAPEVPAKEKIKMVLRSLANVQRDLSASDLAAAVADPVEAESLA